MCRGFAAEGDSGCCICGADYGRYGHNPDPVKSSGRCCDTCNATVVIPARLSMMGFRSEYEEGIAGWDGGHGESYCDICYGELDEPIMSDMWCDGCEMALCDYCFGDPLQEICQGCRESEMASEDNTPIMPPMGFGEMVNWRPLDGTPGLKRQRAEGVSEEITNRLQRLAIGFTGMTVVFTTLGAAFGFLIGRKMK